MKFQFQLQFQLIGLPHVHAVRLFLVDKYYKQRWNAISAPVVLGDVSRSCWTHSPLQQSGTGSISRQPGAALVSRAKQPERMCNFGSFRSEQTSIIMVTAIKGPRVIGYL